MADDVERLRYRLEAQTAQFEREMAKAQRAVSRNAGRIDKDFKRIDKSVAATAAAFRGLLPALGVGALVSGFDRAISKLDAIGKTADRIGFTTDALQELRSAAEQSGVSVGALDVALQRFSRRVAEARQGTGGAVKALKEMGVALFEADGSARSNEAVLNDVADAMQRAGSESDRLRLAVKLFDTEGAGLAVTLRDGSAGLEAMRDRARELGSVIKEDSIRSAEALRTEIDLLSNALSSTFVSAAGVAATALNRLFNIGSASQIARLRTRQEVLSKEFNEVMAQLRQAESRAISGQERAFLESRRDALIPQIKAGVAEINALQETIDATGMPKPFASETGAGAGSGGGKGGAPSDEFGKLTESLIEANSRRADELKLIGLGEAARAREAAAIARGRLENDLFLAAMKDGIPITDDLRATVDAYGEATESLTLQLHAAEAAERAKAEASRAAEQAAERAKRNIESVGNALTQGVLQANSFADALRNVAIQLANFAVQGAFGAGPFAGISASLFGPAGNADGTLKLNAKGNAFSGGNIVPFARGGIVSAPTMFPMPSGAGLMGEAGPEAIMPLRRGPGGRLGVEASTAAPVVNVVVNSSERFGVSQRQGPDGRSVEIVIEQVVARSVTDPGSPISRALTLRGQRTAR